ncbi:hypothetical protein [Fluviicola taffensis]|uniref:hypothetical protein n=1 Tax=Fluviicola taffensis TaxID=191579 RepID=UPI003137B31B
MKQKKNGINVFKFFDEISEIVGWLQIVSSATVLSFLLGCVLFVCLQGAAGLVLGIAVLLLGMFLGVTFATRKYKTTGTIDLLSRVDATPELDKAIEKNIQEEKQKINEN